MNKKYNLVVVGATGNVGREIISILEQRDFPIDKLYLLASSKSKGQKIGFRDTEIVVGDLSEFDFSKTEIGFFSPGGSISAEFAPKAASAGCLVIDNTSHFRMKDEVPLIVPEVNSYVLKNFFAKKNRSNIIANPNCSTIQMLVALKPIYDAVGISRINVATYQAVSGSGKEAITELTTQTANLLNGNDVKVDVYPKQIAFNAIPHIDTFQENGYTREEMKMVWETQKIFEDEEILVNPTAVRIPVVYGHSEALHIETKEKIEAKTARKLLEEMSGVTVIDSHEDGGYPTALDAAGKDPVFVGRIREDISHPRGLNMWVVADNLRKGAALNSVQIAEILVKSHI